MLLQKGFSFNEACLKGPGHHGPARGPSRLQQEDDIRTSDEGLVLLGRGFHGQDIRRPDGDLPQGWQSQEVAMTAPRQEWPKMVTGTSMAFGARDGKVHGRLMGAPDQCLSFHPDAHMLDSWCVLPYLHEGRDHEYNQEPQPPWGPWFTNS